MWRLIVEIRYVQCTVGYCYKEVLSWLSTVVYELLLIVPTINRFVNTEINQFIKIQPSSAPRFEAIVEFEVQYI